MTKPSIEDFNLTQEEYSIEKEKDDKVVTYVFYCIGLIIFSVNLYLIFSGDYSFSFTDIFVLLLMNMIGITIVLTWVFCSMMVLILIYMALQRTILPNLNINIKLSLVKHDPRYIKYKEAMGKYEADIRATYRYAELMQNEMTPKEARYNKIIQEYAKTMGRAIEQKASLYPAFKFPESLLPYKKEDIKKAINYAIQNTTDKKDRDYLEGIEFFLILFIEDEKANAENIKRRNIRERRKRMLGRKS